MAKQQSYVLFELIHSMTKSEKRYFKLKFDRLAGNQKFLKLFSAIEKQKLPDDNYLLNKYSFINPTQISNLKAHLYRQILFALRDFHSQKDHQTEILNWIDYSRILYNKGLYHQSEKAIEKTKRLINQADLPEFLPVLATIENALITHSVSEKNDFRVEKLVKETKSFSKKNSNIHRFSTLFLELNALYVKMGFIKSAKEERLVKRFFKNEMPEFTESKLSIQEKIYLYLSYVSYNFFIQDFNSGLKYAQRFLELFHNEPELKYYKTDYYIRGLNNLLVAQNKLVLLNEFEKTYKELMKVPRLKGIQLNENQQMILFKYKYMHKINHYFMQGDFSGGTKIISVAENELERFALRMDKHYVLLFYYKVACLYFGAGAFRKSARWLNKIILSKDVELREDILSFARILNLICQYELQNTDQIEYQLRATYRFLMKKKNLSKFFQYILTFIRKLNKNVKDKELIRRFSELKNLLLPLEKDKFEGRPFLYFDMISWLESKIEKKPVQEIIQRNLKIKRNR